MGSHAAYCLQRAFFLCDGVWEITLADAMRKGHLEEDCITWRAKGENWIFAALGRVPVTIVAA